MTNTALPPSAARPPSTGFSFAQSLKPLARAGALAALALALGASGGASAGEARAAGGSSAHGAAQAQARSGAAQGAGSFRASAAARAESLAAQAVNISGMIRAKALERGSDGVIRLVGGAGGKESGDGQRSASSD